MPKKPVRPPGTATPGQTLPKPQPHRRSPWAELLARVFGLDLKKCPQCGESVEIIVAILEPHAIRSILTHLRLPDKPPDLAPASIPAQLRFA